MTTENVDPSYWEEVRALFHEAAALPRAERGALLDACRNPLVRAEVRRLLAGHESDDGFLENSIWQLMGDGEARWETATIGPYRLVRELGSGGMGSVYLAVRQDDFEQRVAIKVVRRGAGAEKLLQRFRQERQILAGLDHPNIARLLDGGTTASGAPYFVMEFVDGTPIDAYCRERTLSVEEKLRLFLQLCDAVQDAHRSLVVHRDIKPGNVLVTADGIPKLLDFGIAKLTSTEESEATATLLMTPGYASPEQLAGRAVTTASDVYSLGVLLFELLTGERPFGARGARDGTDAPRASSIRDDRELRGDLDRILVVALARDPNERYGSVERFADDVRRYLDGHPVSARGASFGYRASKFVRRNVLFVATALAAVVVAAGAFVAVVHQQRIAQRRFEQVRSLAHAVVFDLHDAIAKLPGSTEAREMLVRDALGYLDALAAESSHNAPLQMELAGAYQRVGDVQGLPYQPNLGDTGGAIASYRKALAIAESVHAGQPDDRATILLLAGLHDRLGWVQQRTMDFDSALRQHRAALALRNSLGERTPVQEIELARTWIGIGDCIYQGTDARAQASAQAGYEAALSVLGHVAPTGAHRAELLTEMGRAHQRLGGFFTPRDHAAALRHHRDAERILGERAALDPTDAVAKRNAADQKVMTATLLNRAGDSEGAMRNVDAALPVLTELAAADPNNREAQHDLCFAYQQLGQAQIARGEIEDAERTVRSAREIAERLMASDPANREAQRDLAVAHSLAAQLAEARGSRTEAQRFRALSATELAKLRQSSTTP